MANELKGELTECERKAAAKSVAATIFAGDRKSQPGDFYRILVVVYRAVLKRHAELGTPSLDEAQVTKLAEQTLASD